MLYWLKKIAIRSRTRNLLHTVCRSYPLTMGFRPEHLNKSRAGMYVYRQLASCSFIRFYCKLWEAAAAIVQSSNAVSPENLVTSLVPPTPLLPRFLWPSSPGALGRL